MNIIAQYIIVLLSYLALDAVWLGIASRGVYRAQIGHLMSESVNWGAAAIFYALFAAGVVYFVVQPAVAESTMRAALFAAFTRGALLGFLAYGAYDFTNFATLKNWPLSITLIDLAWGTFVIAAASVIATFFARM
ncbi:MAG: DUF2177 family protein [Candidatus Kerfeldbacteria bacterium]|nr:DUF2177 family protein [Candidatus Kerfeldbacteria bacterium]